MAHRFINWLKKQDIKNYVTSELLRIRGDHNYLFLSFFTYSNTNGEYKLTITITHDIYQRDIIISTDITINEMQAKAIEEIQEEVNKKLYINIQNYLV